MCQQLTRCFHVWTCLTPLHRCASLQVGFDPRLGRGEYGSGTYFAEHAAYAVSFGQGWLFATDESSALQAEATAKPVYLLCGRVCVGAVKDFGARCTSTRGDAAAAAAEMETGLPDWPRLGGGQAQNRPPPRSSVANQL